MIEATKKESSRVEVDPKALGKNTWKSYTIRFVFGGVITFITGLITARFGPVVGGLFLAFPAILPASLTLVKKHDGEEKAGDDALGSIAGTFGLAAFGGVIWGLGDKLAAWQALLCAAAAWTVVGISIWVVAHQAIKKKT